MFINQFPGKYFLLFFAFFCSSIFNAQQQPDNDFITEFDTPNFNSENSPLILIDELHNNLHTLNTGFGPFAGLAKADGFKVEALNSYSQLEKADILVIANPINEKNQGNWQRPIYPAFKKEEIQKIKTWVKNGGNLLLIADHMPFAGAAAELAQIFGFEYCDGFAQLAERENRNDVFSRANKRLPESPVTNGEYGAEISSLTSFTGSSFTIPENAIPVMSFQQDDRCLQPEIAWQFHDSTKTSELAESYQGALMNFGKGRLAVFGEAAMFTAQTVTQNGNTFKVGFNSPAAPNNVQFVRNILLWLSDSVDSKTEKDPVASEILAVNREMEITFNNGDFADVADYYAKDAVMLGNNTEVTGRENLREYWGRMQGPSTWKLTNIEIKKLDGDFALQRGISVISWKNNDGEISESKVIFSLLWKRTDEGWKIMLDHYSPR